jgi:hypothetical protein
LSVREGAAGGCLSQLGQRENFETVAQRSEGGKLRAPSPGGYLNIRPIYWLDKSNEERQKRTR